MEQKVIEIWQPRYSTQSVLLDVKKLNDINVIRFTKDPEREGKLYLWQRNTDKDYQLQRNGEGYKSITVICVPLDELVEII